MRFLFFIDSTLKVGSRSGVQRVAIEASRGAAALVQTDFVKWDELDGQLRYLDAQDLRTLFGDRLPDGVTPNRAAHRVHYRLGDTIADPVETWLILPEISYHRPSGEAITARVISQCREYGVRTAAVFYDLIPVTNAAYAKLSAPHFEYLAGLTRCDLILPISHYSAKALTDFYTAEDAAETNERIQALPLPEINSETLASRSPEAPEGDVIILVGTVEPRKRQVEVLSALTALARTDAAVAETEVHVFGALHPDSAGPLHNLLTVNRRIKYFDHADAATIEKSYARARFSVFASNDEGYGLPIAESLARGVPCVTANFGAMAEVAADGGCLTADVNDAEALSQALQRMASDAPLRAELRQQIARRKLRTWRDYAQGLVSACVQADQTSRRREEMRLAQLTSKALSPEARVERLPPTEDDEAWSAFIYTGKAEDLGALAGTILQHAFEADVWGMTDPASGAALVDAAKSANTPGLLAAHEVTDADIGAVGEGVHREAADIVRRRARWRTIRQRERVFRRLMCNWRDRLPSAKHVLTIAISTYNRGPFVEENVRWLLAAIDRRKLPVNLVVIDNLSTDDTRARLAQFDGHQKFRLVINAANVGMLGNLRIVSTLLESRHVWITGDDDFIDPGQLQATVERLKNDPGLPFIMHNFAVYHRLRLGPGEMAEILVAEATPLARAPAPTGDATAIAAGSQHDNLFTAMYPIVWRADILAACFNYPFEGRPFQDLVESIPTTKLFLESYPYVEGVWSSAVGTSGNAHNSWSRHRPRWHGVLMPQALARAQEAGMDRQLLQTWARVQADLFDEAVAIAEDHGAPIVIEDGDRALGERQFRRRMKLTSGRNAAKRA
jgi:glycosyltransferase involved in cell wall biosynthesis